MDLQTLRPSTVPLGGQTALEMSLEDMEDNTTTTSMILATPMEQILHTAVRQVAQ